MFGIIRFESTIGEALGTIAVLWHDYASIHQAVIIAVLSKSLKIFLPWCWTSGLIAERASDKQTHVARSRSSRKASMEYALFLVSSRQSLTKDDRRYTAKPPTRPNDETATLIRQGYALRIAANSHATKQIRQNTRMKLWEQSRGRHSLMKTIAGRQVSTGNTCSSDSSSINKSQMVRQDTGTHTSFIQRTRTSETRQAASNILIGRMQQQAFSDQTSGRDGDRHQADHGFHGKSTSDDGDSSE